MSKIASDLAEDSVLTGGRWRFATALTRPVSPDNRFRACLVQVEHPTSDRPGPGRRGLVASGARREVGPSGIPEPPGSRAGSPGRRRPDPGRRAGGPTRRRHGALFAGSGTYVDDRSE
jgi:hypothetical protein